MSKFEIMLNRGEDCVLDATLPENFEDIANVCGALSSVTRLKILHAMQSPPFVKTFSELSKELNIPMTTLVYNIEFMDKTGLIKINYTNKGRGNARFVTRHFKSLNVNLYNPTRPKAESVVSIQEQQIGTFVEYTGTNFSFVTSSEHFQHLGKQVFHPKRVQAELIYSGDGCLKYYFDNTVEKLREITDISFELELCSETSYYDLNYKSDITFWINGVEVCTYTLPGDLGGRRGKQSPEWWGEYNTQYGLPIVLRVDKKGTDVNGKLVSNITLDKLNLELDNKIDFTFGNKSTATNKGGFNLFGAAFGDYPYHIVLRTTYKN